MKASHQHINQTSGIYEWYTPRNIIYAAKRTFRGQIDLDPASSKKANKLIRAAFYFDEEDDGLKHKWWGNVWLNHPFSRANNPIWIKKLVHEYNENHIDSALCITYACTSEAWFQPLLYYPQCFLCPRTNYYLPDGTVKKGVTKGSVVTYLGEEVDRFVKHFRKLGAIKDYRL